MPKRTLLSWSSGKDSAWALHLLRQQPEVELAGLFCTVNSDFERVAMHAVRTELLQRQAASVGAPLQIIPIPHGCSDAQYRQIMTAFVAGARERDVECMAFGDLYLEDVRSYREKKLADTGIGALFPLWGLPTDELARTMITSGLQAYITCLDPKVLPPEFAGRRYDESFLRDLPDSVDPCGENGEFHSFVVDGPMFSAPLEVRPGEVVHRDGFVFADLL